MNRDFLWSSDPNIKKLHLVGWQRVTDTKDKGGLGLRLARLNNHALLAKCAWKLLENNAGLWGEIVVKKYLRERRLLDYKSRAGDSATWKGIIRCIDLIKNSVRWKIGRGDRISLWYDNWLGEARLCEFVPNIEEEDKHLRLCDVINTEGTWCFDNIATDVNACWTNVIGGKEPTLSDQDDRLLWNETADGRFSCQSAYRLFYRMQNPGRNVLRKYSWIWSAPCSSKIRFFLWLVSQNRLASNHLRMTRKITDSALCESCKQTDETTLHILRHCVDAKKVWRTLLPTKVWHEFNSLHEDCWLKKNLQNAEAWCHLLPNVPWNIVFAASVWCIWKARNARIFKGQREKNYAVVCQIKTLSIDMLKAKYGQHSKKRVIWQHPKADWLKLNVDGSVEPRRNKGAIGGVLRDAKGDWIWGFKEVLRCPTVLECEIEAIRRGLSLAWERRIARLTVETDSLGAFKLIMENNLHEPTMQHKIEECRALLKNPWTCELHWVAREKNKLADALAKHGYEADGGLCFMHTPPPEFISILANDVA